LLPRPNLEWLLNGLFGLLVLSPAALLSLTMLIGSNKLFVSIPGVPLSTTVLS
jgi:hypothetical protein